MAVRRLIRSTVRWLRSGYPDWAPGPDRVPFLALLRNTPMTDAEVDAVVREIAAKKPEALGGGAIGHDEIEEFIETVTRHDGGPENIQRVADKLAEWPTGETS